MKVCRCVLTLAWLQEYESRIKEKVGTDGRLNRSEEKTVLASRKLEEEENRAEVCVCIF